VKFIARVAAADGSPAQGVVEVVSAEGERLIPIGRGRIVAGSLSATADPRAIWGLRIEQRAVVATPVSVVGDVVDLGEIVIVPNGIVCPAFHATDGRVYGIPKALQARGAIRPPTGDPTATPEAPATPTKSRMTFGDLFGSTARQLATAAATTQSQFAIASATVTLKGVPSATEDAISLEFPTAEVAASGVGLSEVSFSMKPQGAGAAVPLPPAGPVTPDLTGYTRDLAIRKAAAAGFITEVSNELVSDAASSGTVIRHLPPAGTALALGSLIRLYVGKTGER
jgi:hypothetical protein